METHRYTFATLQEAIAAHREQYRLGRVCLPIFQSGGGQWCFLIVVGTPGY